MSEIGRASEEVEIEGEGVGEKTNLLAYARNASLVEHRRRQAASASGYHGQDQKERRRAPSEASCIEARNKEETEGRKETGQKRGANLRSSFTRGILKLRSGEENGNGQRAPSSSSSSLDTIGLNNYGAITGRTGEALSRSSERLLSTSSQQLAPVRATNSSPNPTMSEYRHRRYSAISAPAVSLLSSIADDEENRNDEHPARSPTAGCEETPKTKTTSTSATTTTADSGPKKSVDELRNVLTKRWDQLARHRLVVLYAILFVYLLSFLISYVSRFQGRTQLSVVLILCFLIAYCSVLMLLCVTCPLISGRPVFISLVSLVTATLWPVLIWLLTLCCAENDSILPEIERSTWHINGLPSMLLYICALYCCLTFPKFVDVIWGLSTSVLHLVLTYVRQIPDNAGLAQQICANVMILFVANVFGLAVSLVLRRSREFMWREFDDSIEKRATVEYEKERQEQLLLSIIPAHLAARVRKTILNRASKTRESIDTTAEQPRLFHDLHVQQHENVSILFADIVNFTPLTAELTAPQLVRFLNELYSRFDEIAQEFQCMRIKILGDCYYCVSGMPVSRPNHADNCVKMALAMIEAIKSLREGTSIVMDMRIGVHSGSVLCGILGLKKWQYDIWSDDVTIANHMEQGGSPGKVHITKATLQLLSGDYNIVSATTNDSYILAHGLETFYILPHAASAASPPDVACSTSVEDIVIAANGCSAPLAQMPGTSPNKKTAQEADTEKKAQNKQLKVFSPSTRPFDRAKSFSFRQYHGTTDVTMSDHEQKRSVAPLAMNNNVSGSQVFANTTLLQVSDKQRQTAKMSKIIEFWGGADTPFSNLSRRRSSDHVRAASITAIENNYKQYRWRDLISARSAHQTSGPLSNTNCCGLRRREATSGANMALDGTLTYGDNAVEDSFYENAQPISSALSTTLAAIIVFFVGLVGSTCTLSRPDVASSVIFSMVLVFLVILSLVQWNKRLSNERKINYVPPFAAFENYENFSRRVIPVLVMVLSMALAVVFLTICAQPGKCSNGEYDVCLFQLVLLLVISSHRPGFLTRCGVVALFFFVFVAVFFYSANIGSSHGTLESSVRNESIANITMQPPGLTGLPFELRAMFNVAALVFLVLCISWLIEYEAKVDWLCVASFRGEQEDVETMQDINMILLHNILPNHVAAHFLRPERPPEELYHEHHPYVCVMFGSIPNFKDFWSQWDFSRQLECLRLLNEIVCEFDKLLAKLKYSNVEKIKTVGSTYMAVCGLHTNPAMQLDPRRFTAIMVEFAFAMMNLLDQINRDAFQNFQLRIGMSFGPVIAGVIGAQKPQYDIWGNTVNVASRMDTHGVMGKIHVTQDAAAALQACGYEVESRGLIKIKGIKNEIETYFVHPATDRRSVAY